MKTEGINFKVIRELRDGRKSFADIAKKLAVTPNTVRGRVKKLIASGAFEINGLIDPGKLENHFLAIIGIKLGSTNLIKKGQEFSKLKGVVSVGIVTGQFDLIVMVLLNNNFGLLEFITKEVSKVGDVVSTETFVVYKNFNMRIPYVL